VWGDTLARQIAGEPPADPVDDLGPGRLLYDDATTAVSP
jgi:sarcosine oxidase subunit beta